MQIKQVFEILNLQPWVRISVRQHSPTGVIYLGGGHVDRVIRRFAEKEIVDTSVIDNILVIHVK